MLIFKEHNLWLEVILDRPEKANAINFTMFQQITEKINSLDSNCLGIRFKANGKHFCAGADLNEMKQISNLSKNDIELKTRIIEDCLKTLDKTELPIVVECFGYTGGAGIGICAIADIVIAKENSVFACPEIKSGLLPAIIAPYVINKIGMNHAKNMFLTGNIFGIDFGLRSGLVSNVGDSFEKVTENFDGNLSKKIKAMLKQNDYGYKKLAEQLYCL